MRYEFTIDEILVPAQLTGCKVVFINMPADIRVAVSVSEDGEAHTPELQYDGKWQTVIGWLHSAILEAAALPAHQEKIDALVADHVPAFNPSREYGTTDARAL